MEAFKSCQVCQKQIPNIKLCSACKSAYYCSRDCQKVDYPSHKFQCKKKIEDQSKPKTDSPSFNMINDLFGNMQKQNSIISQEEWNELMHGLLKSSKERMERITGTQISTTSMFNQRKNQKTFGTKRKNLQLILIREVKLDTVNEGKFLLVQSTSESVKFNSIMFVGSDINKDCMRFAFYNTSYNYVPLNTWMLIREPMYKLANDGFNIIRVDKEDEIEFINNSIFQDAIKIAKQQDLHTCLIGNISQTSVSFLLLAPYKILDGATIYYEHSDDQWVKGVAKTCSYKYRDTWGRERISQQYVTVNFEKGDPLLLELKRFFQATPGDFIKLWIPESIDVT
ncbi:hypothetical protein FGO68_gene7316 [Halteria grandinella]|uniref:MYND-type domain-containing protein n=1 Tax=Halteria grandinella TaxID=5974 RepID=A0A8J8T5S0_HALGN|nr:hypothetical protein FGO68_gene7316 [Halteria grandinella]